MVEAVVIGMSRFYPVKLKQSDMGIGKPWTWSDIKDIGLGIN